jgi:uncharacterized membrane protein
MLGLLRTTKQVSVRPIQLEPLPVRTYRLTSIDFLRGLVMIIMALDHTRDFFHLTAWTDDPLNMATTTPALFLTRWITHFCAPVFVFLAGTSAFLQSARKSKKELSKFLVTRGLWLVLTEIIIINFAFSFDPAFNIIGLQTIWAIGISMILLGLAIWLPYAVILALGLLIVFGHNSLDFYEKGKADGYSVFYMFLHRPGPVPITQNFTLFIMYPFLSWTGLMLLGYCFGKFFRQGSEESRMKTLTILGGCIVLFFIALRATNLYGDPDPWSAQRNGTYTLLSFLNTHKYPPSLLYMCMTIGPAILFLAWMGNVKSRFTDIITVYGRVPFFFYVLHFFWIHILETIAYLSRGHSLKQGIYHDGILPNFTVPGEGYSLWVVYGMWLFVVISLYPLCKWFSEYKKSNKHWWLSYL